jgi:hypothetical protein
MRWNRAPTSLTVSSVASNPDDGDGDMDFIFNMSSAADITPEQVQAALAHELPKLQVTLALNVDYVGGYISRKVARRPRWKEYAPFLIQEESGMLMCRYVFSWVGKNASNHWLT